MLLLKILRCLYIISYYVFTFYYILIILIMLLLKTLRCLVIAATTGWFSPEALALSQ